MIKSSSGFCPNESYLYKRKQCYWRKSHTRENCHDCLQKWQDLQLASLVVIFDVAQYMISAVTAKRQ